MIIVSFYPGSLGFLLARTIKKSWPQELGQMGVPSGISNHDVQVDLFLNNHQEISIDQLAALHEYIGKNKLVLCHNLELVPPLILQKSTVFSIVCNQQDLATACFLYWCKSGEWHFQWIADNNSNIDFYQACWQQFTRAFLVYRPKAADVYIKFADMQNADSVARCLQLLAQKLQFGVPVFDQNWYLAQYQRSIAPLLENSEIYSDFQKMFIDCLSLPGRGPVPTLKEINKQHAHAFCRSVDLWVSINRDEQYKYC